MENKEWTEKLKNSKPLKSIDLINSEGAILKAHKMNEDLYIVQDQWKKVVKVLDGLGMFEYTRGDFDIVDTEGRAWNYKTQPQSMIRTQSELDNFIGIVDG